MLVVKEDPYSFHITDKNNKIYHNCCALSHHQVYIHNMHQANTESILYAASKRNGEQYIKILRGAVDLQDFLPFSMYPG